MMWSRVLPGSVAVVAALTIPEFSVGAGDLAGGDRLDDPPEPPSARGQDRVKRVPSGTKPALTGVRYAAIIDLGGEPSNLALPTPPSALSQPGVTAAGERLVAASETVEQAFAELASAPTSTPTAGAQAEIAPLMEASLPVAPAAPLAVETAPPPVAATAAPIDNATALVPAAAPLAPGQGRVDPASLPANTAATASAPAAIAAPLAPAPLAAAPGKAARSDMAQLTTSLIGPRAAAPVPVTAAAVVPTAAAPAASSQPAAAPRAVAAPVQRAATPPAAASATLAKPGAGAVAAAGAAPAAPRAAQLTTAPSASAPAVRPPAAPPTAAATLPKPPPPAAGLRSASPFPLDIKSRLVTRVDGKAAGAVDFAQTATGLTVRLGSIVELLGDRFDTAQIARIRASSASNTYLSLAELQAQGIPISYDPVYDEFNVGTTDTRPKAARKVHMDQISTPERGASSTGIDQVRRK